MNRRYHPMLMYIYQLIVSKNKNFIIVINGDTGSGKTYAAIRFAIDLSELMGNSFSIKDNIDFNFVRLLKKMKLEKNTKPGSCFVFEEVGAVGGGASSSEWQSKANALFGSFLQTSRCKQRILIMTCPSFSDLDVKGRRLCHSQWEMQYINYRAKKSLAKPNILQINRKTGKVYFKYLRFSDEGDSYKLNSMEFKLPPDNVLKDYKKIKDEYVNWLEESIIEGPKEKELKKRKHNHLWRVRLTKNDRYCRSCGKIEDLPRKNGVSGLVG